MLHHPADLIRREPLQLGAEIAGLSQDRYSGVACPELNEERLRRRSTKIP
jgi:hypothetical protein